MNISSLRYWVFTSGEQGIHGLDWGIKHASESFSDRQRLDTEYRALLRGFGLAPGLERPAEGVGLMLLRWSESDFIAGFIFPGTDHGGRPNTSSVVCVIPSGLSGSESVNDLLRDIWEHNDIAAIARKDSRNRPGTLGLDGGRLIVSDAPGFRDAVSWPSSYNGWLCVDGIQRRLLRQDEPPSREEAKTPKVSTPTTQAPESKTSSGWKLRIGLLMTAAVMAAFVVRSFVYRPGATVTVETNTTTQSKTVNVKTDGITQSKTVNVKTMTTTKSEPVYHDTDTTAQSKTVTVKTGSMTRSKNNTPTPQPNQSNGGTSASIETLTTEEQKKLDEAEAARQKKRSEIEKDLKEFFAGSELKVEEKSFTFRVKDWDNKRKRFNALTASIKEFNPELAARMNLGTTRSSSQEIVFTLRSSTAGDDYIAAFLNQM